MNRVGGDANLRDRHHLPGAAARPTRPGRHDRKGGVRNASQITLAAHRGPPLALHVIDDLPDVVPVGAQELDVIETYLSGVLSGLLGEGE